MKNKLLMIPFIAALALAGCTNGEDPGIDVPNEVNGQVRYLAVNIVTPAGVRADAGYQPGSEDEDAVETATFVLLNNENKISQVCSNVNLKPWSGIGDYDPNVENISSAVLLIEKEAEKPAVTGIIAILNANDGIIGKFAEGKTLDEVKAIWGDCATTGLKGSFIMTNSVYYDANALKIAADVTEANLGQSEDAAKNNPVKIYVERVVARIDTSAGVGTNSGATIEITNAADGSKTTKNLTIAIKGIAVENHPNRSYLLKNIDGLDAAADLWTGWNDAANYRSYWAAKMPTKTEDAAFAFQLQNWNEIQDAAAHKTYVQENIDANNHTAVIVTAQLMDGENPLALVKIANTYYTPNDALTQIAGSISHRHYRIKDASVTDKDVYVSIPTDYFEWAEPANGGLDGFEVWEGYAKLKADKESETYYEYIPATTDESGNAVPEKFETRTAAQINEALKAEDLRVLFWNDGMCYYYANIEHHKTLAEDGTTVTELHEGVIRNHIYNLNLQSIKGVGVPVFNPTQDIYPKRPDEENLFYLAARINILKWKIVNQNVNLE